MQLWRDGRIVFYYRDMDGYTDYSTIGYKLPSGERQFVYDDYWLDDRLEEGDGEGAVVMVE